MGSYAYNTIGGLCVFLAAPFQFLAEMPGEGVSSERGQLDDAPIRVNRICTVGAGFGLGKRFTRAADDGYRSLTDGVTGLTWH